MAISEPKLMQAPALGNDRAAHKESLTLAFPVLVSRLVSLIGKKLTAFIAGVKDVRTVDGWIAGAQPYGDVEPRLRFAFQVTRLLSDHDSPRVIQAWLVGVNPELGDRVPIRLLRESELEDVAQPVLGAVRAFISGG